MDDKFKASIKEEFFNYLKKEGINSENIDKIFFQSFFLFEEGLILDLKNYSRENILSNYFKNLVERYLRDFKDYETPEHFTEDIVCSLLLIKKYLKEKGNLSAEIEEIENKINRPSVKEVFRNLLRREKSDKYERVDKALRKLFNTLLPKNDKIEDILIKVATLNDFYNTNVLECVFEPFTVD
ncbi:MAG: hypothetical protein ACLFPS_06130, partial [Clostridia bacterium]